MAPCSRLGGASEVGMFLTVAIVVAVCSMSSVLGFSFHSSNARVSRSAGSLKMEIFEGNPTGKALWDQVWKLDFMKKSEQVE